MTRRVQILVALVLTALWGAGIYAGHANGHLRFLDRLEATLTDWRTQVRGVQAPPDLVTIVAIDDTVVKRGGSYPLPRADRMRGIERGDASVVNNEVCLVCGVHGNIS